MGFVNKKTVNIIVEQGGKLGKSSLAVKPQRAANIEGLRYVPQQLSADVAEVSQNALQSTKTVIEPATLQELAEKNLSLNQMASKLGVNVGILRRLLNKNNIATDAQKEFRILKQYFTAATQEEKAKAFKEVDKYLEQIAREEVKLRKGYSYEDCLQDVRLRFFELVDKKEKGQHIPRQFFQALREIGQTTGKKEIQTVSLERSRIAGADRPVKDSLIDNFEINDFFNAIFEKNDYYDLRMRGKDYDIFISHIKKGRTLESIRKQWNLPTIQVVKRHLNRALNRAKEIITELYSEEHFNKVNQRTLNYYKKIGLLNEADKYSFVDGKYAIKK